MAAEIRANYWLFSQTIDLTVFLGSALLSLALLAVGWQLGVLNGESPEWTWVSAVLFIDVAHVWSTSFRVYFDKEEFKRRFRLYLLVPVFGYAIGVALYSEGELVFWKALAAVAVFHFIRQQYGWVALYRRKLGETANWTWWIDAAAVYLAQSLDKTAACDADTLANRQAQIPAERCQGSNPRRIVRRFQASWMRMPCLS